MAWSPQYDINDPRARARWLAQMAEADYRRECAAYQQFLGDAVWRRIAVRRAAGSAGFPGGEPARRAEAEG